jgi:molecular chaperone GrpE
MKDKKKAKPDEEKEAKSRDDEFEKLREERDALQNEKNELLGKLQRVSADYANFQKRVPKQISDTLAYEKEKIIKTLLPALDNLEHTFQNAHSAENVDALIKGIRIIYDQMLDILESHGVEQIKALGEHFDPSQHEAVMQRSEPDKENNTVLEEFQKGYKLNDRVIRPTKVVVNKLASEEPPEEKQEEPTEQATDKFETVDEYETTDTE